MPFLASVILALTSAVPVPVGDGARVEVLEGRGVLAGSGVVVRMSAGDPERWIDGAAHLELSAGSRARVTWSGRASLLLEGRNVFEWRPAAEGTPPAWDLAEVGAAHLELRRGPLDLSLAGGWGARLQSGACALRGLPGDGVELDHQAGLPLDLWPPQRGEAPSVPFTVLAGARLRLVPGAGRPLALAGSQSNLRDPHQRLGFDHARAGQGFPAWRGFAWPWSSSVPTSAIEAALPGRARGELPELPDLPERARATAGAPDAAPRAPAIELPRSAPETPSAAQQVPGAGAAQATPGSGSGEQGAEPFEELDPDRDSERAPWSVREHGVLVITPYGPRWLDASRAVDPELLRLQAERERR